MSYKGQPSYRYYGRICFVCGPFKVSIDGSIPQRLNTNAERAYEPLNQWMVWSNTSLDPGRHTVNITSDNNNLVDRRNESQSTKRPAQTVGGRQPDQLRTKIGPHSRFHLAGCGRAIGEGGVLVGRTTGHTVQRANRPNGKPRWSPTHGASALRCMTHFPSFPTKKKKKRHWSSRELPEKVMRKDVRVIL